MYFKAIIDNKIVDVYDQLQFVKYDEASRMVLRCEGNDNPQGIIQRNGETLYNVEGWPKLSDNYETVKLSEFDDADKYMEILEALNANDDIEDDESIFDDPQQSDDEEIIEAGKNQYVQRIEALENITNIMMEVFDNG
ncbi:MAG: hypothetical protein ACLSVX_12590 [Massilimicrobiota timonensis]